MNIKKKVTLLVVSMIVIIVIIVVLCYPKMTKITKDIEEVAELYRMVLLQDEKYYEEIKNIITLENEYSNCKPDDRINVEVQIKSTFHIFNRGKVEVEYSKECYNNEEGITYGAYTVPTTLWIKKKNGKWIITKKYETA